MKTQILKCTKCNTYTLKQSCPKCDAKCITSKPAKFSPEKEEKYSKYKKGVTIYRAKNEKVERKLQYADRVNQLEKNAGIITELVDLREKYNLNTKTIEECKKIIDSNKKFIDFDIENLLEKW